MIVSVLRFICCMVWFNCKLSQGTHAKNKLTLVGLLTLLALKHTIFLSCGKTSRPIAYYKYACSDFLVPL